MRSVYDRKTAFEHAVRVAVGRGREGEELEMEDAEGEVQVVELNRGEQMKWMWGVSRWRGGDIFCHD